MNNPKEIIFSVESPCNADWDTMNITAKGKHCQQCDKEVIDASNLSPEEIFSVYKQKKGHACMRMRTEMVEVPHILNESKWYTLFSRYYKKIALFAGMQFLFLNQMKAQVKNVLVSDKNSDGVMKRYLKSIKISGMVADSVTKEPIPYVKVQVKKNNKIIGSTNCQFDGTYTIDLKDTIEDNEPASIEFLQTMFDSVVIKEFRFNKSQIFIDTVYLRKSFTLLKEIEIISPKLKPVISGNSSLNTRCFSMGKIISVRRIDKLSSANELAKLLQDVPNVSPRQPRINISGEPSDLVK